MASGSSSNSLGKRKKVTLSIEEKLQILKEVDRGSTLAAIARKYGLGKSTVSDIKRGREKIMKFASEVRDPSSLKKRCIVRKANNECFDQAMHLWFVQERHKGTPISGVLLMEKARILYQQMYPSKSEEDFKASTGWLQRFKDRHGIRQLRMQGETLSADTDAAKDFVKVFHAYIEERQLCMHQIFNCDETGLYWRLLPSKTLADGAEKQAKNSKTSKDRVTLMATANASGDFRLPLVMIHKSAKPRCFSGINMSALPVHFYSQKNAWMDGNIFHDWFHKKFIPIVKKYLEEKSLPIRAVLLLDNAPSHPAVSTLASADGNITCLFLPPNVTSILQPMDQGVLENLKRRYKWELLRKLLLESDESALFTEFCKTLTIKVAVYLSAKCWEDISSTSLSRAWNKLLSSERSDDEKTPTEDLPSISDELDQLGITESERAEWLATDNDLTGVQEFSDGEIIDMVRESSTQDHDNQEDSDADEVEEVVERISHSDAEKCFGRCLQWLEQQPESTPMDLMLLQRLQTLASNKRISSLKQSKLTSYV